MKASHELRRGDLVYSLLADWQTMEPGSLSVEELCDIVDIGLVINRDRRLYVLWEGFCYDRDGRGRLLCELRPLDSCTEYAESALEAVRNDLTLTIANSRRDEAVMRRWSSWLAESELNHDPRSTPQGT